jgi:hypothetical protein
MKSNNLLVLILFCCLIALRKADTGDFTIFPEDTSIRTDYIFAEKTGEFFYGAYYFGNIDFNLYDYRNGISVTSYKDVKYNYIKYFIGVFPSSGDFFGQ